MSTDKLVVGDFGDRVTSLQENLKKHGFNVSADEEKRKFFGPTTREAVGEFQKAHGIDLSCEVCAATAARLEARPVATAVGSLGLKDGSVATTAAISTVAQPPFTSIVASGISGIKGEPSARPATAQQPQTPPPSTRKSAVKMVASPLHRNDQSAEVVNLQEALLWLIERKVFQLPEQDLSLFFEGLRGEQKTQTFNDYTEKLIGLFQKQFSTKFQLTITGAVDFPTADALNNLLKEFGAFSSGQNEDGTFTVVGIVTSATRAGVDGLRVVIVDKNIGQDVLLAETMTGNRGVYQTTFSITGMQDRCKQKPDLQSRVFVGETFLGASDVRYNASNHETLDILLEATASSALPSEHETLISELTRHCQVSLQNLKENKDQQDITYLANKTGWDARAVALAALADQFSARTRNANNEVLIEPAFFYALFRAGLPANEDTLYRADAKTIQNAWKLAVEQGVIPPASADELSTVADQFQQVAAQKLLTGPALAGGSSLKDMLISSRLTSEQQTAFAKHHAAHRSDKATLWSAIESDPAFGRSAEERRTIAGRLQVNGKLGYLTINNAPLMDKIHASVGNGGVTNTLQLAEEGYHRAEAWDALLTGVFVPNEIAGEGEIKRANYAEYLAAQVRLSYPTASVAQMVKAGTVTLAGTAEGDVSNVHQFLTEHQGKFEIGMQPVEQYIVTNNLRVAEKTVEQIKRLQRVYHMTPNDQSLAGLLKRGINSALDVIRYDKGTFIQSFAEDLGGRNQATLTYDRAAQIHNTVLHIALSYLSARTAPMIGVHSPANILDPTPANAGDVIAYATLETLFGSMDFCACDHCRSILSPAAYLVNLLQFIGSDEDAWMAFVINWKLPVGGHGGAPYPFMSAMAFAQAGSPVGTEISPFEVLMSRRPDIQHLPLTCENTNTAIPYIDIVNEILEYFIANSTQKLSLQNYKGHDTDAIASEDLLASPQFVIDSAYATLADERFPAPLPFHRALESVRLYFEKFDVPLAVAMERLRKSDDVERGGNPYGWRDILIEEIGLSREEYQILTDSAAVPLWRMYGFPNDTPDEDVIAGLSNASQFAVRLGISYEELVSILLTQFVNPNSVLVPKLERLGVSFATLQGLKDGSVSDADFDQHLADLAVPPNPAAYGGEGIKAWVRDNATFSRIMGIITLTIPVTAWVAAKPFLVGDCIRPSVPQPGSTLYFECTATGVSAAAEPVWSVATASKTLDGTVEWITRDASNCSSFGNLAFRYSDPAKSDQHIGSAAFIRLLRFIRLWKKLSWTIDQTDAAICSLYQANLQPFHSAAVESAGELDAGFVTLLPRLGISCRVMNSLDLTVKRDLLPLLACWSEIGTHGSGSLYGQMFLNPALLRQDDVFADKGTGEFLIDSPPKKLIAHGEAIRSAFNLTGDEFERITLSLGYDSNTNLTIDAISAIYRRGWLARKLKISVREFLLLTQMTRLDPFGVPDVVNPAILHLINLVEAMRDRSFKPAAALYLFWNHDLSNKSPLGDAEFGALVRELRSSISTVEAEFAVSADADGSIAQNRMEMVYGSTAATFFFGLLNDSLTVAVDAFSDPENIFASGPIRVAVESAAGKTDTGSARIAYDDFRKQLSYSGVLTTATRDAIKLAVGAGGGTFKAAMDNLLKLNQSAVDPFFSRYPELASEYAKYSADITHSAFEKRATLLQMITPELIVRRKRQEALQIISGAASADLAFAQAFVDPGAAPYPFHGAGSVSEPALKDVLGLETSGLSVQFFAGDAAAGTMIPAPEIASNLDYAPATKNQLPANPTVGAAVSGKWQGFLEAPETGFFNLRVDADATASVTLVIDSNPISLNQSANLWTNGTPLELRAGNLYPITLTIEKVRQQVRVQWEWAPKGQGRVTIPPRYLYAYTTLEAFRQSYVRFLKAASIAAGLCLTPNELEHFATNSEYHVNGKPWMNALAVKDGASSSADAAALLHPLEDLLGFARIKTEIATGDESLLVILKDPVSTTSKPGSLLFTTMRWNPTDLDLILTHFNWNRMMLGRLGLFSRMHMALGLIQTLRISSQALIQVITNEPTDDTVRDLQAALRARYDAASWRDIVRPISDVLRGKQRDALVAYILHKMSADPLSKHIDTPDKLFEYFLMDVQMDPCMETSRVRHALSSVQLFIERCLINIEPRVSSAAINAKQWEWMKRYRVWEANRKVYLYPENWLEPELRDDKSPLFKQLENELKQGDITEARAAIAYGKYLSQLEEIAKPESVGIHHVPRDDIRQTGEVNHVVGRTTGAGGKYYYRRQEGGWTPWEPIKLDIEDKPVCPIIWKDRLLLFWLRLIKEVPLKGPAVEPEDTVNTPLAGMHLGDIKTSANLSLSRSPPVVRVKAILCWSEYQDGIWQTPKTSDVHRPADLGEYPIADFDRSRFWLAFGQADDVLRVEIQDGFVLGGKTWFHLYNTFSAPVSKDSDSSTQSIPFFGFRTQTYPPLRLNYWNPFLNQMLPHDVLGGSAPGPRVIAPLHLLANSWIQPFFYEDSRHAFYVTSYFQPKWIWDYLDFGFLGSLAIDQVVKIPPIVMQLDPGAKIKKKPRSDPGPLMTDMQTVDPDANIRQAFATAGAVKFGDNQIGPSGVIPNITKI